MKKSIIAGLMASVLMVGTAQADDGAYASLRAGWAFASNMQTEPDAVIAIVPQPTTQYDLNFGSEFSGTIAGGYAWDKFMAEGEIGYTGADFVPEITGGVASDGTLLTGMANFYFNPQEDEDFQPYIGGGVGLGRLKLDQTSTTKFAFQALLGGRYRMSDQLYVGVEYRYMQVGSPANTQNYRAHGVMATFTLLVGGNRY